MGVRRRPAAARASRGGGRRRWRQALAAQEGKHPTHLLPRVLERPLNIKLIARPITHVLADDDATLEAEADVFANVELAAFGALGPVDTMMRDWNVDACWL